MTLTEFLLARIAEDEVNWRLNATVISDEDYERDVRRVLADCEAKRRIIMWHELHDEAAIRQAPSQLTQRTLGCLALPYADHPNYCEEWRP